MADGWKKYEYNYQEFGQQVKRYRKLLGWSLGELSQLTDINKGTLYRVEEKGSALPEHERKKLIDVLTTAAEEKGLIFSRQNFLKIAGLAITSIVLRSASPAPVSIELLNSPQRDDKARRPEEYAELLNTQGKWQQAANFWLLSAREAKKIGDWSQWARGLISAGQMGINLCEFADAESSFMEVLGLSENTVRMEILAEAYIRLGWLCDVEGRFEQAESALRRGLAILQRARKTSIPQVRFPEHTWTFIGEGAEALAHLENLGMYFLGRAYCNWGIKEANQDRLIRGRLLLKRVLEYEQNTGEDSAINLGFYLMNEARVSIFEGETRVAEKLLRQCESIFDNRATVRGHLYLRKGSLVAEEKVTRSMDFYSMAREGYKSPAFYPKGLSEVLREMSVIYSMDTKNAPASIRLALQYALVAVILHPYGENLDVLAHTAYMIYRRLGESIVAFKKYWQDLKGKVWLMDSDPFSDLRILMESFEFTRGSSHIEAGLNQAEAVVSAELVPP
jgi:tetratricopeptide (TPR) repeat protein